MHHTTHERWVPTLPLVVAVLLALVIAGCAGPSQEAANSPAAVGAPTVEAVDDDQHAEDSHHDESEDHHDDEDQANIVDDHHVADDQHHGDGPEGAVNEPIEGAREIQIVATEFAYSPSSLTLEIGEPVNITLINDGAIEHDLELSSLGLHLHLQPGESAVAGVVPESVGTYDFECTIPGHREAGMTGELIVVE